jgi:hypothetical protein
MNGESNSQEPVSHESQTPTPACSGETTRAAEAGPSVPTTTPPAEISFVPEAVAAPAPVAAAPAAEPVAVPVETVTATAVAPAPVATPTKKPRAKAAKPTDMIEQKIVIRRDRWESLLGLTGTLAAERAVNADPSEVAAIVLEAGLAAILEEARAAKQPRAKTTAPVATKKPVKAAKLVVKKAAAPVVKVAARKFRPTELKEIHGLVKGLKSDRAIQRTLALWLGAHSKKGTVGVPIEDLRYLCRETKVYDTANFAQNMKKDSAYFVEVRDKTGDRLGYSLTAAGVKAAEGLHAGAH